MLRPALCGLLRIRSGHLVGQHPEAFRAGILRNPVLDLGLMVFCTDIPDWTYVEAWGGQAGIQKFKPRPDAQDLERFYEVGLATPEPGSLVLACLTAPRSRYYRMKVAYLHLLVVLFLINYRP